MNTTIDTFKKTVGSFCTVAVLLFAVSCQCGQPKHYGSNYVTPSTPAPEEQTKVADNIEDEQILERAKQAFYKIPDHKKVSPEAKSYMTSDLYNALSVAWDVPMWGDGEIGGEEFLFYFVTGNDPSSRQTVKSAELTSAYGGRYAVIVKYLEFWGNTPADDISLMPLVLVNENGYILLDDFGSDGGTKDRCKQYILDEVNDYLSGKTVEYMKNHQQDEWYTDEHIRKVENSFNDFITRNKSYLEELK